MGEKVVVEGGEAVVHIAVVGGVDLGVVREGVVSLMPRVLDEGDSGIAKRRGELGSNPTPPYLIEICGKR